MPLSTCRHRICECIAHDCMVNTIINCSWLHALFTRPIAVTRHLYNQLHCYTCLVTLILNCTLNVIISAVRSGSQPMFSMWLIESHTPCMCLPLVGGCVGLTKTDVLKNTMLVGYQQGYWSCIGNGVNTLYSLNIFRSLVHMHMYIYTHLHQN